MNSATSPSPFFRNRSGAEETQREVTGVTHDSTSGSTEAHVLGEIQRLAEFYVEEESAAPTHTYNISNNLSHSATERNDLPSNCLLGNHAGNPHMFGIYSSQSATANVPQPPTSHMNIPPSFVAMTHTQSPVVMLPASSNFTNVNSNRGVPTHSASSTHAVMMAPYHREDCPPFIRSNGHFGQSQHQPAQDTTNISYAITSTAGPAATLAPSRTPVGSPVHPGIYSYPAQHNHGWQTQQPTWSAQHQQAPPYAQVPMVASPITRAQQQIGHSLHHSQQPQTHNHRVRSFQAAQVPQKTFSANQARAGHNTYAGLHMNHIASPSSDALNNGVGNVPYDSTRYFRSLPEKDNASPAHTLPSDRLSPYAFSTHSQGSTSTPVASSTYRQNATADDATNTKVNARDMWEPSECRPASPVTSMNNNVAIGCGGSATYGVVGSHRSTRSSTPNSFTFTDNSYAMCDASARHFDPLSRPENEKGATAPMYQQNAAASALNGVGNASTSSYLCAQYSNSATCSFVGGSVDNSASDVGLHADLDVFGSSLLRASSGGGGGGGLRSEHPHSTQLPNDLGEKNNTTRTNSMVRSPSTGDPFSPVDSAKVFYSASASASSTSFAAATAGGRSTPSCAGASKVHHGRVPSFEQTDRFMAEFFHYQEQQEDELAFYNQQREEQLALYQQAQQLQTQQRNQRNEYFGRTSGISGTRFARIDTRRDPNHQFKFEPAPAVSVDPNNNDQENSPPSATSSGAGGTSASSGNAFANETTVNPYFPFASDIVPVLPSQMSLDPSAKKKKVTGLSADSAVSTLQTTSATPPAPSTTLNCERPSLIGENNRQPASPEEIKTEAPQRFPSPFRAMSGNIGPPNMPYIPPPQPQPASSQSTEGIPNPPQSRQNKRRKITTNALGWTRFMPPPPPSLQAARVMTVCLPPRQYPDGRSSAPGDVYYTPAEGESVAEAKARALSAIAQQEAQVHKADHKTCRAEGEFAFLTKTPGTSDWSMGYGASYSATVAEGAPGSTFAAFDEKSESFQSYLRVLMQWYSRVACTLGHNELSAPDDLTSKIDGTQSLPLSPGESHFPKPVSRQYLYPQSELAVEYFTSKSIPPCPRPENYFKISRALQTRKQSSSEPGSIATPSNHNISICAVDSPSPKTSLESEEESSCCYEICDTRQFIAWLEVTQSWWKKNIEPRMIGHRLHLSLLKGSAEGTSDEKKK